jgi:hypothetical protein
MKTNCIFYYFATHIIVSNIFIQALSSRISVQDISDLFPVLLNNYIDPLPSKGVYSTPKHAILFSNQSGSAFGNIYGDRSTDYPTEQVCYRHLTFELF